MNCFLWIQVLILVSFHLPATAAFQAPFVVRRSVAPLTPLLAKKKKKKSSAGKGFGKEPEPEPTPMPATQEALPELSTDAQPTNGALRSVQGGSDSIPTFSSKPSFELDPNLSADERTEILLREKFGLKTIEERRREEQVRENRDRIKKLTEMAESEDFDIMQVIPAPLLIAIDRFLKVGLAIVTVLFISAGIGITAEAWSAATGNPLPENVDQFIVNVVEPNFTPGLFVLLAFSVSLGIFASLQLGSGTSQYKESP